MARFSDRSSGTRREGVTAAVTDVAQVALVNWEASAIARAAVIVARAALVAREIEAAEHQLAAVPALLTFPLAARELLADVSVPEMR